MALAHQQTQEGGENAINAQAGRDVVIMGVTYAEARQIALDVFKANAVELAGQAQQIARERAEHLTEQFLEKLQNRNPDGLQQACDPDFQHSILEAQKAFARSGDDNLEAVLTDLLVERTAEKTRSLRQLVLTQSIETISRLTSEQIDILTIIFLTRHTKWGGIKGRESLVDYFKTNIIPVTENINWSDSVYSYLSYTGTATIQVGFIQIPEILRRTYPGLVSNGLDPSAFSSIRARESEEALHEIIAAHPQDPQKQQIYAIDADALRAVCSARGISQESTTELTNLLLQNLMSDAEIIDLFSPIKEPMEILLSQWSSTTLQNTVLTPVGLAIAHSNAIRRGLRMADLDNWLR
ncbi:TPA: hypothetical protein QDA90_003624 [Burkholderia vietnamiensis]|nr:hypothetical protein [Burkholderia vietnamiensis]HDR8978787.1 hypothetical protein [Burkholderia vietnamiensis]HDR9068314.1 hypothetical protein [Burkholderia vietnamiensis]